MQYSNQHRATAHQDTSHWQENKKILIIKNTKLLNICIKFHSSGKTRDGFFQQFYFTTEDLL